MSIIKNIALVAHDAKKKAMTDWAIRNSDTLSAHKLWATGTTGSKIAEATQLDIECLKSGPLGGDQQLGAMIAEGRLDVLIFFTDPMSPMPHDVDVKALLRISTLYDTALACNEKTADYILSSPLLTADSTKNSGV